MAKDKCNLCEKDRKGYNGLVWYSGIYGTDLCESCYLKWLRTKECKSLENKYKGAKTQTKEWGKMCKEQQKAFDKWYYANGGVNE